jgi:hypothetical protein
MLFGRRVLAHALPPSGGFSSMGCDLGWQRLQQLPHRDLVRYARARAVQIPVAFMRAYPVAAAASAASAASLTSSAIVRTYRTIAATLMLRWRGRRDRRRRGFLPQPSFPGHVRNVALLWRRRASCWRRGATWQALRALLRAEDGQPPATALAPTVEASRAIGFFGTLATMQRR